MTGQMRGDHLLGRQAGSLGDKGQIGGQIVVIANRNLVESGPVGPRRPMVKQLTRRRFRGNMVDNQRIEVDQDRGIGGNRFDKAFEWHLGKSLVEPKDAIMDLGRDGFAELHQQTVFSDRTEDWKNASARDSAHVTPHFRQG